MSQEILAECIENFGEAPRSFSLWDRWTYLRVPAPDWARKNPDEALNTLFRNLRRLLEQGEVVWGHIIQANTMLFSRGRWDCPADVVFSLRDSDRISLEDLGAIAHEIFQLKHTDPANKKLARIAEHLTNERTRAFGNPVPQFISPQFSCLMSTIFVVRKHLPGEYLRKSGFPLVVSPTDPHIALPLPSRYWPDSLVKWWMS